MLIPNSMLRFGSENLTALLQGKLRGEKQRPAFEAFWGALSSEARKGVHLG